MACKVCLARPSRTSMGVTCWPRARMLRSVSRAFMTALVASLFRAPSPSEYRAVAGQRRPVGNLLACGPTNASVDDMGRNA
eukprot:9457390-Pyramimonas_sp.AAC.1